MIQFYDNEPLYDTAGQRIQAHGGFILHHDDRWYWYGENKAGVTIPSTGCDWRVDVIGISCYSSTDLRTWVDEGLVLPSYSTPGHDLHPSRVVERPRVLHNTVTGKFVMWLHVDSEDYTAGRAGVAEADSPTGPFRYLDSYLPGGGDSRDFTLFEDSPGEAYILHATDWNRNLRVTRLTPDYLRPTADSTLALIDQYREAPVVWKQTEQLYYMISSGTTGWDPNPPLYASAPTVRGPWKLIDNPVEPGNPFPVQATATFCDRRGQRFLMTDHWRPGDLSSSAYRWFRVSADATRVRVHI